MMQKVTMKRALTYHVCASSVYFSPNDTQLESNSLVYTYENDTYTIYKILNIQEECLFCVKQGKFNCSFPETPGLNWSMIGVFRKGGLGSYVNHIYKSSVAGKVLKIGIYLITCPNNALRET